MASITGVQQLAATLVARCKTLINNDLKRICKEEGLPQSGIKAQLQTRVIQLIQGAAARNDLDALHILRHRLSNHGEAPPTSFPNFAAPSAPATYDLQNGYTQSPSFSPFQQPPAMAAPKYFFKDSPFFEIRELLIGDIRLDTSPSHRQNVNRHISLSSEMSARMKNDPTLRLLLFSAIEQPLGPYQRHDIAFPSQIEVRINGDEVKANFKGLKNKPGSTRPADITDYIRKTAHYRNTLLITYALTQKASEQQRYTLHIYMVKKQPIEDLAKRITTRNVITKQSVINEMLKKANDPDIEVGSVNMSLKDPISTLRIAIPCRSNLCNHNQCFDAESFLQLQEQAPTWQCPVCNKTVSFEGLAVDEYVQEILDSVPKGTDQVTIDPNGKWSYGNRLENGTPRNRYPAANGDDSDDDLIEIPDYRVTAIKSEGLNTPQSLTKTPPLSSREASTAPRIGSKRTAEVIDLTLSDDEEPPRPTKKVAYSTPSSLPDPSRQYRLPSFGSSSAPMRPQPPHVPSAHAQSRPHSHNSPSTGLRLDLRPPSTPQRHLSHPSHGTFHQPPPSHPSFSHQGSYPTYGGSS